MTSSTKQQAAIHGHVYRCLDNRPSWLEIAYRDSFSSEEDEIVVPCGDNESKSPEYCMELVASLDGCEFYTEKQVGVMMSDETLRAFVNKCLSKLAGQWRWDASVAKPWPELMVRVVRLARRQFDLSRKRLVLNECGCSNGVVGGVEETVWRSS